jgi:hypothetical protein
MTDFYYYIIKLYNNLLRTLLNNMTLSLYINKLKLRMYKFDLPAFIE